MDEDEEEMLRQALLMSMNDNAPSSMEQETAPAAQAKKEEAQDEEEDEDAKALALALAMSQEEEVPAPAAAPSSSGAAAAAPPAGCFLDPNYVNELLEGIEGVNMDDPQIKSLLAQFPPDSKPGDGPDSKKQKKEDEEK